MPEHRRETHKVTKAECVGHTRKQPEEEVVPSGWKRKIIPAPGHLQWVNTEEVQALACSKSLSAEKKEAKKGEM